MIRFACPHCKTNLQVKDSHAGAGIACPKCKATMTVPAPPGTPPAAGAAAGFAPPPAPPPLPVEPAEWFHAQDGQQAGPVTWTHLRQIAAAGQLQPGDMVWKNGMASWAAAGTINDLFPKPATAPPPLPPVPVAATPRALSPKARVTADIELEGVGGTTRYDRIDVFLDGSKIGKGSVSGGIHLTFESTIGHHSLELRQSAETAAWLLGTLNESMGNYAKNNYPVHFKAAGHYAIRFKTKQSWLGKLGSSVTGNTLPTEIEVTHSPEALEVVPVQAPEEPEQGLLQKGFAAVGAAVQGLQEKIRRGQLIGLWEPVNGAGQWILFTRDGAMLRSDGYANKFRLLPDDTLELSAEAGEGALQMKVLSVTEGELILKIDGNTGHFKRGMTVTEAEEQRRKEEARQTQALTDEMLEEVPARSQEAQQGRPAARPTAGRKRGFFGGLFAFLFNYKCPHCNQRSGKEQGREFIDARQQVRTCYEHDVAVQRVFNVALYRVSVRCSDCGHRWRESDVTWDKA